MPRFHERDREYEYESRESWFPKSNHTEVMNKVNLNWRCPTKHPCLSVSIRGSMHVAFQVHPNHLSESQQLNKKLPRAVKARPSRQVIYAEHPGETALIEEGQVFGENKQVALTPKLFRISADTYSVLIIR